MLESKKDDCESIVISFVSPLTLPCMIIAILYRHLMWHLTKKSFFELYKNKCYYISDYTTVLFHEKCLLCLSHVFGNLAIFATGPTTKTKKQTHLCTGKKVLKS